MSKIKRNLNREVFNMRHNTKMFEEFKDFVEAYLDLELKEGEHYINQPHGVGFIVSEENTKQLEVLADAFEQAWLAALTFQTI